MKLFYKWFAALMVALGISSPALAVSAADLTAAMNQATSLIGSVETIQLAIVTAILFLAVIVLAAKWVKATFFV